MAEWTIPLYTRDEIAEAGRILAAPLSSKEDREQALAITNNWRSSHAFPLNTFQMGLRRVARKNFDPDATVAQRLKRLPSIQSKLQRLSWLSLAEMQDLGGCRAVVSDVEEARALGHYYVESSLRHELLRVDDYIANPKRSGYRSVHLIWAYHTDSERRAIHNGQVIEMQLRSRLQHAWATAVETVDLFTAQALKSSAGEKAWQRFFVVMSSALAYREGTSPVPDAPTDWHELVAELTRLAKQLKVIERLAGYSAAMRVIEGTKGETRFVLLELDTLEQVLQWEEFSNQLVAADMYEARERALADVPGRDVVLVRVDSLDALRKAYPNYFADTSVFVAALEDAMTR